MNGRGAARATVAAALAAAALAPTAAQAASPQVRQLVAFRDGSAVQRQVTANAATARVGNRRCAVAAGTAMAALVRSGVRPLRIRDYGECSRRPVDAAGLYVVSIRDERARRQNGWVYKVGNKVATAGAADPSGAFGRGRLREGQRVTWFYCRMRVRTSSCQRTLGLTASTPGGGTVHVTVRAYDDRGRSRPRAGATVHAGVATATTGSDGKVTMTLPRGRNTLWASAPGVVRSFRETIDVQ
jgi:hypothetical protein